MVTANQRLCAYISDHIIAIIMIIIIVEMIRLYVAFARIQEK